jgi:hypothetical protein
MSLDLPMVSAQSFVAEAREDGASVFVELRGTADIPAREPLDRFIMRLHSETLRTGAKEIVMDLGKLEFMNSSCMKTLVSWLTDVQGLPVPSQYRICFRSNREILWQRRSLQALKCFADALVRIEA